MTSTFQIQDTRALGPLIVDWPSVQPRIHPGQTRELIHVARESIKCWSGDNVDRWWLISEGAPRSAMV
jgi:hypothetical protein